MSSDDNMGLGDLVKKVTHATGIDKLAQEIAELFGTDCGCEERQEKWNEVKLPFKKKQDGK